MGVYKIKVMNVDQAREVLKQNGFFVDNLWHIEDVKSKFNCTDEQAQYVLEKSLTNEATMEQVWLSIGVFGEMENLKEK
jgi:Zn finger protein HypA/HybF involved in hydrogenase expression